MLDLHAIAVVFSVYIAGVIIPGPNFVAVAHRAASSNIRQALALVAGIVVVNLFWATCSILGIGIVFATFPWIALAVKIMGAGYLIWFGGRLIVRAGHTSTPAVRESKGAAGQAFRAGVATNIANPKAMAFYAAVFAAAAPRHVNAPTFFGMLATVAVVATVWYGFVAILLATPRIAAGYRRGKVWMDRFCGTLIVAAGIRQLIR
ncbi:threonine/homoserine/homoserine lactone efflux protein [Luteibacter sp. Sphag1AF]|uniref:LysE family translocator n=1 Tax=Luteibacter sp. Sphag1AF TaxID=2587031 RepID=UPI0016183C58|nr:LysE family translocator [Luteibacter sp. Sphag1AF]MBB3228845.1 threonine/homoserine/homoserine lactone efflux protein [Luteibacter sp. Sphag1AF]